MIQLVLRKILSNSWKVACLLLGSILVVGMVCSIPMYADGIMQRLLTRDLENAQLAGSQYPGYISMECNYGYIDKQQGQDAALENRRKMADLIAAMPIPAMLSEEMMQVGNVYRMTEVNGELRPKSFVLGSLSSLPDHVRILKGRMYQTQPADGVVEVIVDESSLKGSEMVMDRVYEIYAYRQKTGEPALLKVMIVGLFERTDNQDVYWYPNLTVYGPVLLLDPALLEDLPRINESLVIDRHQLFAAFDYHRFRIEDVGLLEDVGRQGMAYAESNVRTVAFSSTFMKVIEGFGAREAQLNLTLQILNVPILLMLAFYIFMVSQLMVRSETSVISVLESRGYGRSRILMLYGLESLLLGGLSLLAGSFLGVLMVRVIGASNGFLDFVSRKALKTELDREAILYGIIAVFLFILMTQLPVYLQSRTTIVQQKRKKSRLTRAPFWKRMFLDVVLLGASFYALYRLNAQVALQKQTGTGGIEMNLDFLLFLATTLFILGAGLLVLRLYPYVLRLVYLIGQRLWNPVIYASFHQIGRSDGQEQFVMLFLILALSIGLFNANAARTINRNTEDSISCQAGADIRLQELWQPFDQNGQPIIDETGSGLPPVSTFDRVVKYFEPDIGRFARMPGVGQATRVYRFDKTRILRTSKNSGDINLMAIDPYAFALTAWSRSDLNRYQLNEYMNVLSSMPNGVILSSNLRDKIGLKVGDAIVYTVNNIDDIDGVVVAFVDYWPGFQPQVRDPAGKVTGQSLLVSNLEFVLSKTTIQPYEVWLKRSPEATDKTIYGAIQDSGMYLTSISSTAQQIVNAKNDPQLQGTNGALSLGFIVSMLICACGFLLYWIMSVQGRVLQFGVFRAMGLGKGSVIGMLLCEQVLVSGVAILCGVFLGALSSKLYLPLFQLVFSPVEQPLPFRVISEAADARKIYVILGCLLLLCCMVLIRLVLRIRIDQAVKLGEE